MLNSSKITGFADEIHPDIKIQVKLLQELGIQYLELRSADGKNVSEFTEEEAAKIKKYLVENQIKVSAIGSPVGKISVTDDFGPHFETYQRVVETAKIMETPYVRTFSFYIPKGENPDKYQDMVFTRMNCLIEYAVKQNIILIHENEKGIYGDVASRCLNLFEKFYCDHFKCTFDFANFVQCGQNTQEAFDMLKPYIEYVHIKDAMLDTGKVTPAGQGDGKVKEILTELDSMDYSGFLSLEPHLAEFAALKNLEKNPEKRMMSDGEAAFNMAYEALMKILN